MYIRVAFLKTGFLMRRERHRSGVGHNHPHGTGEEAPVICVKVEPSAKKTAKPRAERPRVDHLDYRLNDGIVEEEKVGNKSFCVKGHCSGRWPRHPNMCGNRLDWNEGFDAIELHEVPCGQHGETDGVGNEGSRVETWWSYIPMGATSRTWPPEKG